VESEEQVVFILHFLLTLAFFLQLILRSETRYYSRGSIIADSSDEATALMVITSGKVMKILPGRALVHGCVVDGWPFELTLTSGRSEQSFPSTQLMLTRRTKRLTARRCSMSSSAGG
jgi:hypothetical protein